MPPAPAVGRNAWLDAFGASVSVGKSEYSKQGLKAALAAEHANYLSKKAKDQARYKHFPKSPIFRLERTDEANARTSKEAGKKLSFRFSVQFFL